MTANARLTQALVRRGVAPSFASHTAPQARPEGSVVQMRKPRSMTEARLDASIIVRRHAPQTALQANEEARAASERKTLMDAFARDVREQNSEFDRNARMGYVDPEIMEPWQKRRRFT